MNAMARDNKEHKVFDFLANKWMRISMWTARHPLTLLLCLVGVVATLGIATVALIRTEQNSEALSHLCSRDHNSASCQRLFRKLFEHPSPEQVTALRQILRESSKGSP